MTSKQEEASKATERNEWAEAFVRDVFRLSFALRNGADDNSDEDGNPLTFKSDVEKADYLEKVINDFKRDWGI